MNNGIPKDGGVGGTLRWQGANLLLDLPNGPTKQLTPDAASKRIADLTRDLNEARDMRDILRCDLERISALHSRVVDIVAGARDSRLRSLLSKLLGGPLDKWGRPL